MPGRDERHQRTPRTDEEKPHKVVERFAAIMDALQAQPEGAALDGIARAADMPKSTTYRYLSELETSNYCEQDRRTGEYLPGRSTLPLTATDLEIMVTDAIRHIDRLRDTLGETVVLAVLERTAPYYVHVADGTQDLRVAPSVGETAPLAGSAVGKMIAAQLDQEELDAVVEATEAALSSADLARLEQALDVVREQAFALDDDERTGAGRSAAVAVPGAAVPAAVAVCAPANRLSDERIPETVGRLREVARLIGREPA